MSAQHSPSFCRMPPDSFFASRSGNGASPVLSRSSAMRWRRSAGALAEQAPEEVDVFAHGEVGIEVLAEPLRHVGDARAGGLPVTRIRHVAAENRDRRLTGSPWRRR